TTATTSRLRAAELLEQQRDDRHAATGSLPLVANAVVVDETGCVGRDAECLGGGGRERRRLDLVAVRGERFEPVPQRVERRRRLGTGGQRVCGRREELVDVDAVRPLEAGHRVQSPLDGDTTRPVV